MIGQLYLSIDCSFEQDVRTTLGRCIAAGEIQQCRVDGQVVYVYVAKQNRKRRPNEQLAPTVTSTTSTAHVVTPTVAAAVVVSTPISVTPTSTTDVSLSTKRKIDLSSESLVVKRSRKEEVTSTKSSMYEYY